MKKVGRIAIVYPYGNLDSVPSLCSAATVLAANGYCVDILTCFDNAYVSPGFTDERIAVLPVYNRRSERIMALSFLPGRIYRPLYLLARHLISHYICVIGVDPHGLIRARSIAQWLKVPLVYYSLELLLSHELTTTEERWIKNQERTFSKQATFVIIQDAERAELLIQDNGLSPDRVFCVPNAPLGRDQRKRSNYLRDKYGLPSDSRIILHSGAIHAWAGALQLVQSTQNWPDQWVLVCHTRFRSTFAYTDVLVALKNLAIPGRVIFSTDPVSQWEYPTMVQSADIGVAFYIPQIGSSYTQDNIRHLGLSSGKLAYYLQAGLPVLVNDIPSLQRLVGTYQCGDVITDPSKTRAAIDRILVHYEQFSQNAVTCFNREFDFADKFDRVLSALKCL